MGALVGETLCSGIGAPEVAAPWIDWRRAWDIDDFARAVFRERHGYAEDPTAPRFIGGDFTVVGPDDYRRHGWPWPDVIVAGTPCQAFSVAGFRRGLEDERGNVTLEFVKHVHAVTDAARSDGHDGPVVLWENVPGVFSQSDNAFGAFLGGLVGADDALPRPFGQSWPDAGMAAGLRGRLAWRVFDAQHFGLAQRRRRVFLVFDPGDRADPAAVLFERKGVRGHPAARREAREDVAAPVTAGSPRGSGYRNDADTTDNLIIGLQTRGSNVDVGDVSGTLGTNADRASGSAAMVAVCATGDTTHALTAEGHDASEDGTGRGNPIVAVGHHGDVCGTLSAKMVKGTGGSAGDETQNVVAIGFNARQDPDSWKCRAVPLDTDGCTQAVAFSAKDYGADAGDLAPTLRAMGHADSHMNGGGQIAIAIREGQTGSNGTELSVERTQALRAGTPHAVAFAENSRAEVRLEGGDGARTGALWTGGGKAGQGVPMIAGSAVRRLTPTECERLQGFPDGFTNIPWRGGGAPDSRRYKALGNSMAVPVLRWILSRLSAEMEARDAAA